jgi:hypothetical protein
MRATCDRTFCRGSVRNSAVTYLNSVNERNRPACGHTAPEMRCSKPQRLDSALLLRRRTGERQLRRIAPGRPPVKLFHRLFAVPPAAGFGLAGGCRRVPPNVLFRGFISISLSIAGSQHDFKLIEFIPLSIGPLSVRDRQKRLQALSGGNRSRFVHGDTISLFDTASLDQFRAHSARRTVHRGNNTALCITARCAPRPP